MLKTTITILVTILSFTAFGQVEPAPEYLQGKVLPDSVVSTTLINPDSTKTTLAHVLDDQNGEKVVLWFWASWCGDSHADISKLKKLQRKVDDDVVFLLLSKDQSHEAWEKVVSKLKVNGLHYRIAPKDISILMSYIDLDWIPRYVVLDETGSVIVDKAINGKDKKLKSALLH